jgi:hypothetical protein
MTVSGQLASVCWHDDARTVSTDTLGELTALLGKQPALCVDHQSLGCQRRRSQRE